MKLKSFMLLLFIIPFLCTAQDNVKYVGSSKQSIIVEYFNAGYGVNQRNFHFVDYLHDKVVNALRYTDRVNVGEVNDIMELRAYSPNNNNPVEYMRNRYDIMNKQGYYYSLECDVSRIDARWEESSKKWVGVTSYTIKLIDTRTGNTAYSLKYNEKDSEYRNEVPEKAITYSLDYVGSRIRTFIFDNFRIQGQILQVISLKKEDEVKEVAINVGPENTAQKGTKFEVYIISKFAGQETTKKIGEIKIEEVKGAQLSLAKVTKGGKEIKIAADKGETMMILSAKSGFWDSF
ncbi:MAG: hypothetical protein RR061_07340 [Muribaculaceae bacterium]